MDTRPQLKERKAELKAQLDSDDISRLSYSLRVEWIDKQIAEQDAYRGK